MVLAPYSPHPKNPIKSWQELIAVEADFEGNEWAFRGQDTLAFPATSLERHCKSLGIIGPAIADLEVKLVRDFARRYHLYAGFASPPKGYTLEWLSLLRHFGTPTRLVDFTYSFFTASYFALETADGCAVIWAFNVTRLSEEAKTHIATKLHNGKKLLHDYNSKRDGSPIRALFMSRLPLQFVYSANPLRLNERLTIQQGLFLAPGDVTATFEENLRAVPNHASQVMQIMIDPACRQEVLRKLYKMGINTATLFPGLEGFAKSLSTKSLILKDLPTQDVETLEEV